MSDAGRNRREKAAAARSAAESAEKRRERTIRIAGAATVVAVVVAIIGVAIVARNADPTAGGPADPVAAADPAAKVPAGTLPAGDEHAFGVVYGSADGPTLAIWEDFQCPACGALEEANGAGLAKLADEGKVRLVWRPTAFLDRNLGNDSSQRAIAAWGCAIDQGKAREFHDLVYANQPETEGTGWTDSELTGFAESVGVADIPAFEQCVADRTYLAWAANSTQAFYDGNVQGTPFGTLDGVEVPTPTLADPVALEQFIADAAK